jgi:hypothetical protein
MKRNLVLAACLAMAMAALSAAVPPAEQILPADTLGFISVPDWGQLCKAYDESPQGQFWQNVEMKAFKDKFMGQLQKEVLAPLERELGVKFTDYASFMQGQVTLAVLRNNWGPSTNEPSWLFYLDTKDKKEQLKTNLMELRKKWVDAGRKLKTEKIRDLEFSTLIFTDDDIAKTLRKAFPPAKDESVPPEDKSASNPMELIVGQWESLLLMGCQTKDLERTLARLAGGQVATAAEQAEFRANQNLYRNALVAGWFNLKLLADSLQKIWAAQPSSKSSQAMGLKPEKVASALGVDGLKSLAFSASSSADGLMFQFFLQAPAAERKGLVKLMALESKSAGPPSFVPTDATSYSRWRFDAAKAWSTLETTLAEMSPELNGVIQMAIGVLGKNIDPQFDFKKSLVGNLGDDYVSYQKNPRNYTLEELDSPPALTLVGSPNADPLLLALRTASASFAPQSMKSSEREFLGRKIYTTPFPSIPGDDQDAPVERALHLAASGGYVALSFDPAMVEEYLRSSEAKVKPLEETPGLKESAQVVGGFNTGAFWFENQNATMRVLFEVLKKDTNALDSLFSGPWQQLLEKEGASELKAWMDFSLLPSFEKVAKFFHFGVHAITTTTDGMVLKAFYPTPPGLKGK